MAGGFFIAVCVALYAYEYGNLPETAISVDDLGLVSYSIHGFLHIPGAGRRCR